jgi:hypothetical protein
VVSQRKSDGAGRRRKYRQGPAPASLNELVDWIVDGRWIWWHGRPVHPGWMTNMSLWTLARCWRQMALAVPNDTDAAELRAYKDAVLAAYADPTVDGLAAVGTAAEQLRCIYSEQQDRLAAQQQRIAALEAGLLELHDWIAPLMAESRGLAGFHCSGAEAPWSEFEELSDAVSKAGRLLADAGKEVE